MPEISRFYGISITMNYNEHNPPHFHALYQDFHALYQDFHALYQDFHALYQGYEVSVEIKTGIVKGTMPKRALNMIFEWLDLHKETLLDDWELAQNRKALIKIAPLT